MEQTTDQKILNRIAELEKRMDEKDLSLWKLIRVAPEKLATPGGNIWVVGIAGNKMIWHNEQEDRFAVSAYQTPATVELHAGKIAQSDVPDNMLSLLTVLRAMS